MKIHSDITTIQEAKTFIDHLYNIKSSTSDKKLISLIDDYLARVEDEDVTVGELQSLLAEIIQSSNHYLKQNNIARIALSFAFSDIGLLSDYRAVDWIELGQEVIKNDNLFNKFGNKIYLTQDEIDLGRTPATAFATWKASVEMIADELKTESTGKNIKLNDLGVINITLSEFKEHAANAQNDSIDVQLECGSSDFQSKCKVGFLSTKKFQQFLDENPDFHTESDSDFYNWDIINPELQGLDVYLCYISDLNLFGYYSK